MKLSEYKLPKKLKTKHYPNKLVEIWLDDRKVTDFNDVPTDLKKFFTDFVTNMEKMGYKIRFGCSLIN